MAQPETLLYPDKTLVQQALITAGGLKRLLVFVLLGVIGSDAFAELPREVKQALASRDYESAVVWLEANANDPEAAFELGRLYRLGRGVPENPEKALTLFRSSAEAGDRDAQYQLGKHYEKAGDLDKAAYWMTEAGSAGHRRAAAWTAPVVTQKDRDLAAMIRAQRPPPSAASPAQINRSDSNGKTPLMIAAGAGDTGWLKFLLAGSAAINAVDKHGVTALQRAVIGRHAIAAAVLLQAGAEPDLINREGNTALHLAVAGDSAEITDLLLAAHADRDLRNGAGWSSEALAARSGDPAMMRRFGIQDSGVERAAVVADPETLNQLVIDAAQRGNESLLEDLLSQSSFDADATELQALLVKLCTEDSVPALKRLVDAGVPVEGRNGRGQTTLLVAAETGCQKCIEILVSAGAGLETADAQGRTPLMVAARAGHDGIVSGLLEAGARIDSMDELERNALWWAVREKHWTVARHLLEQGSPVKVNARGINPLHLAAEGDNTSILPLLVTRLPVDEPTLDGNTALLIAAHAGSTEVASELLRLGAEVDYRNDVRDTALIIAARQSQLPMARVLLDAGADPRARNDRFESAHSIVADRGEVAWLKLLESSKRSVLDLLGAR